MQSTDTDDLVIRTIQEHYDSHDSPFYLAALGELFRDNNIPIPDGVRFKDYLKIRFAERLVIVQDAENPARIAIAPPEKESQVREQLADQVSDRAEDSSIDHARLPFALIAAFCKATLPGAKLYFRVTRPFRYETGQTILDDDYIEIEDRFRPAHIVGQSVHKLSPQEKQTIYEHIDRWAVDKSLDLRKIYYDRGARAREFRGDSDDPNGNALVRLINAQEPDLREHIRIPGDIAITLMQIR